MWVPVALLVLAISSVWLPVQGVRPALKPWLVLFVASMVTGFAAGALSAGALALLLLFWLSCAAYNRTTLSSLLRSLLLAVVICLALGLAAHQTQGFTPIVVRSNLRLTPESAPMTLRAHYDKGAAGLLLLIYCCRRSGTASELLQATRVGLIVGLPTAFVVISAVAFAGAIHIAVKWPVIALQWMVINLFLTCLMEEAFFRGLLQDRLSKHLGGKHGLRHVPLAVSSVLFGLAHAGGGLLLLVSATAAGIGYGIAYAKSGRIEAAITAHFLLNLLHFLGFTYPYAVR